MPMPLYSLRQQTTGGKEAYAHVQDAKEHPVAHSPLEGAKDGGGQPPLSFTGWLYHPYLDLSPAPKYGNPQTEGLLLALRAFLDEDDDVPRIHALFTPSTRVEIVNQSGAPLYHADDPRELPRELRTAEWQALCDALATFDRLDDEQQVRVLWLLHRLHMHRAILGRQRRATNTYANPHAYAYMHALAQLALAFDREAPLTLNLYAMERVAMESKEGSWEKVEATYHLTAISGKFLKDEHATKQWAELHREAVEPFSGDKHTMMKLWSRYHRAAAFVPMLEGNKKAMVREMDAAEVQLGLMETDTPAKTVEYQAVASALYESRAKEALLLGDHDLALERADKYVSTAPRFPSAHLCRGQVLGEASRWEEAAESFRLAALYGPPYTERALFHLGNCLEQLDDLGGARDAYLAALKVDPLGDSSYERLHVVADTLGERDLAEWAASEGDA